jgi:hypothetical protein
MRKDTRPYFHLDRVCLGFKPPSILGSMQHGIPNIQSFEEALSHVELTSLQKSIVKGRYIPMIRHIYMRTYTISFLFHSSRIIITIGSLIVPALLSIQGVSTTNVQVYWATWVISLLVTISNALVALFKFDKRYYYLHTILERLISEGWQYIELTGKYSGFYIHGKLSTHENQFVYFCHSVEKIRMKQVEDEYYKPEENQTQITASGTANTSKVASLLPPTPQEGEFSVTPDIALAVKEQLSRQPLENAGGKNKESEKNRTAQSVSVSFDMS